MFTDEAYTKVVKMKKANGKNDVYQEYNDRY